jgi:4-hydroxybenzoate polyprenyltransferase
LHPHEGANYFIGKREEVMKRNIYSALKILRPGQWLKNVFILAPLIFAKHLFNLPYVWREMLAFFGFCVISSIIYIVNDIFDCDADKLHPIKRNRPLASGAIGIPAACIIIVILLVSVVFVIPYLHLFFWYTVIVYVVLNLAYSMGLKRVVLVDIFIISAGYMLRVLAGVFAIEVEISPWLILCTMFISVFLAISKRRGELILSSTSESFDARPVLRHYELAFIDQIMTIAASGVAISYALYTVADRTVNIFKTEHLIFTTVFVLFGIFRYILLMRNKKTEDNPMHLLLKDAPMIVNILLWFIVCVIIIYIPN